MAETIIALSELFETGEASAWEEHIFQAACAWGRERAERLLRAWDDELLAHKPAGWRVEGFRERRVMTRFGEVRIRRRLYRDEQGRGRFPLDELLGLPSNQLAVPVVTEKAIEIATEIGFKKTGKLLESLTGGELSAMAVWRLLKRVGERALEEEAAEGEAVYRRGEKPRQEGNRIVERLYMEGDGVWVRLQREQSKWMEIRLGIAYEGWQALPEAREGYALVGKWVYVHGEGNLSFWEGASLAWSHHWDMSRIQHFIVGGDGARWIRQGVAYFPHSLWQLDGFHLSRGCRQALGKEEGARLFQAIREGRWEEAERIWETSPRLTTPKAREAQQWVSRLLAQRLGEDWRVQQAVEANTVRGMGSMEGNNAHLIADRMKGKGRSWSRRGALRMAKVRELVVNQVHRPYCRRAKPPSPLEPASIQERAQRKRRRHDTSSWLHAEVPILHSAESQQECVRRLRQYINGYRLN